MERKIKGYCEICDEEKDFIVKKEKKIFTIRGVKIKATINVAVCPKCGERIWTPELIKENDNLVYDAYKKKAKLLTSLEIKEIRTRRNFSQRELADLIECGEKNIARYENGAIQDKTIDLLIRLVGSDDGYKLLLKEKENNNRKIICASDIEFAADETEKVPFEKKKSKKVRA